MSNPFVAADVRMTTDKMSTAELVAFYLAATQGAVPAENIGYEVGKPLLTEQQGTRVHSDALKVLDVIVQERLQS